MNRIDRRQLLVAGVGLGAGAGAMLAGSAVAGGLISPEDKGLLAAIADPRRKPGDRARDIYRHPAQSLAFWGLRPGATVLDVDPGSGWWTDILAPYLKATGGRYIAGGPDFNDPRIASNPKLLQRAQAVRDHFLRRYGDKVQYGDVSMTGFGKVSGPLGPAGSVDLILLTREVHNWAQADGFTQKAFADFKAVLKPGGYLGIEDHRAPDGADSKKGDGYISEAWVIDQARQAGLKLDARSEINANPKDTKDHPFGVWTLPPTRRSAPEGQLPNPLFDHSRYDAIGESDRMTLRFAKA
jgi:predicted methyltransferase